MKFIKKCNCFIDRIGHDMRLYNVKPSLILGGISLFLGILSWILGGRGERMLLLFIFPRTAFPLGLMYFVWAISFFFIGAVIGGIAFGCEKYKRKEASKAVLFLALSVLLTLLIYPMFFRSMAPFITFLIIVLSCFFCFLALISCSKIYSLWTLCIGIHMLWLLYNGYLSFCVALIN